MSVQYLRFADLQRRGVVSNRMTLARWIRLEEFPPGLLMGPRVRAWSSEAVQEWLDRRRPAVAADYHVKTDAT
jgi:predicted DNA-binding transcriptional regulator AlpA